MLLLVAAASAQDPLPTASGPLLLPVRTTNLSRGEAVAVDSLFRAHLELALGSPLYAADDTRTLVLRTGELADPMAQCRAIACPRVWTIEVVRLGDAFHVEVIDRDPDGRVRVDLSATTADLDGLAPLARDLGAALQTGGPTGGWQATMPTTTAAIHAAAAVPAQRPRSDDPHATMTYGPYFGGVLAIDGGSGIPAALLGFSTRLEREHMYLHGSSAVTFSSPGSFMYVAVDAAFGGGWNGPGTRNNAFFGGGGGVAQTSRNGVGPDLFAYGEGGVAFLRQTTSRVYLSSRITAGYSVPGRSPAFSASLDVGAGF